MGVYGKKDNISLKNKQCEGCLLGLSDDGRFYVINCKKNGKIQSLFNEVEDTPKFNLIGYQIEIAEMIFNKMEELHVSQAELARRLGKTRSYVSKLLSKGSNFTLNTLLEIAISLNSKWEFRLK